MTKKLLIALFTGIFLTTCSPHLPVYKEPVKNEVDVIIKKFDINEDGMDYSGTVNFQKQIAQNVAALFQKMGITAVVVPENDTQNIKAKYEIKGTVLTVDPGSFGLRCWLGMSPAKFKAKATLVEKQSNMVVEEFKNDRTSGSCLDEEQILQKVCLEVSRDIIDTFKEKIEVAGELK